jgi:hypothetical protein
MKEIMTRIEIKKSGLREWAIKNERKYDYLVGMMDERGFEASMKVMLELWATYRIIEFREVYREWNY